MKVVFFGTPDYVVPIAEALFKEFRTTKEKGVVAVVTQAPKPAGREKKIEYSAVDTWAYKHKIPIFHNFEKLPEAELGVVAAYGKIIPKSVIEHFLKGILNVHPSLLPQYRGASPIQAAIAAGEAETGVTVIKMDELMDHGPIISSFKEEIGSEDTNETLRTRLFERSAEFLISLIPSYISCKIKPKDQNHKEATFTKLITKDNGFIKEPFADPVKTEGLFRAFDPWPGIWTYVNINKEQKRLKILKLHLEKLMPNHYSLVPDIVQLEGKKPVTWEEFKKGYPNFKL